MRRSGPPWGAWLSSTPWAGRYLACRPAVPALVNVSPVKWALVKFTSLPANSAQTNVILPPTNLAPPGHEPLPQLAQSRPQPERHHLGLRAQVPGSTMLARGTGDWAARSRRCHGGHEHLQRSLAPSCPRASSGHPKPAQRDRELKTRSAGEECVRRNAAPVIRLRVLASDRRQE